MIQKHHTDGGCMVLRVKEPDAPCLFALITDEAGSGLPENMETEAMLIGAYSDGHVEALSLLPVKGRHGLIAWYTENVGYDPDKDVNGVTPMDELIDRVASLILLQHASERQIKGIEGHQVIKAARITAMPKTMFDLMPKVIVTLADGAEQELFSFFPDEISFAESEFIGLTIQQANELRHKKDVAFLKA